MLSDEKEDLVNAVNSANFKTLTPILTGKQLIKSEGGRSESQQLQYDTFKNIILSFANTKLFGAIVNGIKKTPPTIVSNIKSANGSALPTMSIFNLISSYQTVLAKARTLEFGKNNLLVENPGLIRNFEKGIELELESGSKDMFLFNDDETFTLWFSRYFLSSSVNTSLGGKRKYLIQP